MGITNDTKQHKLYIRLPFRINEEFVVRDLHSNIVQVDLPRQKSRRWCIVSFESSEKLQEALVELKKVKFNNKSIKIYPYNKSGKKRNSRKTSDSLEPCLEILKKSS